MMERHIHCRVVRLAAMHILLPRCCVPACVLQLARDADPMSMIRLAKMYLNGQGCQRNIALAQEWVRKAR